MGRIRADKCNTVHDRPPFGCRAVHAVRRAVERTVSGRHFCFLFNKCGTAQLFAIYLYL